MGAAGRHLRGRLRTPGGSGIARRPRRRGGGANYADGTADRNHRTAAFAQRPGKRRALGNTLWPDAPAHRSSARTLCADRTSAGSRVPVSAAHEGGAMNAEDVLIILPVSNAVLFPGVVLPIAIASNAALAAAQEAVRTQRRAGLLLGTGPAIGTEGAAAPGPENLHRVGTAASIVRFITAPDGTHHLMGQGEERFTVREYVSRHA